VIRQLLLSAAICFFGLASASPAKTIAQREREQSAQNQHFERMWLFSPLREDLSFMFD
jgi:hypothetical protein